MDAKILLNLIGFLLAITSILVMYGNSAENIDTIDGGNATTDFGEINRITKKRNNLVKIAVAVGLLSSALQFVSNFIPQ